MAFINRTLSAGTGWRLALATLSILLSTTSFSQKDKHDLSFRILPDTSYHFTLRVEMDQVISDMPTTYLSQAEGDISLAGIKDDVKTIRVNYGRHLLHIGMEGYSIHVDTDSLTQNEEDDPEMAANPMAIMQQIMEATYSVLTGSVMEFKLSPSAEVIEFTGTQQLVDAMLEAMPAAIGQDPELRQKLETDYNDEKMKSSFANSYDVFVNKPVAIGESWTSNRKLTVGANVQVQMTYTLKAVDGDRVTVAAVSSMKPGADADETKMTGSHKGTIIFNKTTGEIYEQRLDMELEGEVNGMPFTATGVLTYKCLL